MPQTISAAGSLLDITEIANIFFPLSSEKILQLFKQIIKGNMNIHPFRTFRVSKEGQIIRSFYFLQSLFDLLSTYRACSFISSFICCESSITHFLSGRVTLLRFLLFQITYHDFRLYVGSFIESTANF